jgi:ethanolamine permease
MSKSVAENTTASISDAYWFGVVIVLGGQLLGWNISFMAGFWSALGSLGISFLLYLTLVLCLAEMTGTFPFSGGAYGFARVTLGTYMGFLLGTFESLQYILYVTFSIGALARLMTSIFNLSNSYEPIFWVVFYILALSMFSTKQNIFWKMSNLLGILTLVLILMYIGILAFAPPESSSSMNDGTEFVQTLSHGFMKYLPYSAWFFVGVESMPLLSSSVKEVM